MTSGGGLTTLETAARFPIRLVESGPAGGAILSTWIAEQQGIDRLLSFDMGGTTAKICLIDDGKPMASRSFEVDRRYRFMKGSGLPVRIPVIEMVEIGAGGGSMARVDTMKRITVGPGKRRLRAGTRLLSTAAAPSPTVTDADLVLGRSTRPPSPAAAIPLDAGRRSALDSGGRRDRSSSRSTLAAFGVSEVVEENMANAAASTPSSAAPSLKGAP